MSQTQVSKLVFSLVSCKIFRFSTGQVFRSETFALFWRCESVDHVVIYIAPALFASWHGLKFKKFIPTKHLEMGHL